MISAFVAFSQLVLVRACSWCASQEAAITSLVQVVDQTYVKPRHQRRVRMINGSISAMGIYYGAGGEVTPTDNLLNMGRVCHDFKLPARSRYVEP